MEVGAAVAHASARRRGSGSPQKRLQRSAGKESGFKTRSRFMNEATEGTENQTVTSERLMKSPGLRRLLSLGQQTHAPQSHAAPDMLRPRYVTLDEIAKQARAMPTQ